MKTPVIRILATGELLDPNECFIFTCGTLLHNELDRYGFPDEQVIYTPTEWEWSEEDLDIFSHQSYKEYLEEQKIQEKIDSLMEGVSTKEYTTRRRELETEFGLRKQNQDG